MKRFTTWLQNSVIPLILTPVSVLITFLLELQDLFSIPTAVLHAAISVAFIGIVWIFYSVISSNSRTNPTMLGRLLLHKVPTNPNVGAASRVQIMLVYSSEMEKLASQIKKNFGKSTLMDLVMTKIDSLDADTFKEELVKNNIAGIYWLYDDIMRNKDWVLNKIEAWSDENDFKPVIYVTLTSDGYDPTLNFARLDEEEAPNGLWRLLSRAYHRTKLWKEQATLYRQVFFISAIIVLLFITGIITISYDRGRELKHVSQFETSSWRNFLNSSNVRDVRDKISDMSENKQNAGIRLLLKDLFQPVISEILLKHGITAQSKTKLTLWKQGKNTLEEIIISNNDSPTEPIEINDESMVGCAFFKGNKVIMFRKDLKDGETAAWSYSDLTTPIGNWVEKSKQIVIDEFDCNCEYDDEMDIEPIKEKNRTGMLLMSFNVPETDQYYAFVLDTELKETSFLSSVVTREYLFKLSTLIVALPPEVL